MTTRLQLSRKETYSGSMVIFIGIFYLMSLASALFQPHSIPANRMFGITEAKFLFLSIFYCYGAISLFRKKNWGWVICTATLLNFVLTVLRYTLAISQGGRFDGYAGITIGFFLLLLMAFLFLFGKSTRIKFSVDNKSYLLTIGVYSILLLITILL